MFCNRILRFAQDDRWSGGAVSVRNLHTYISHLALKNTAEAVFFYSTISPSAVTVEEDM